MLLKLCYYYYDNEKYAIMIINVIIYINITPCFCFIVNIVAYTNIYNVKQYIYKYVYIYIYKIMITIELPCYYIFS